MWTLMYRGGLATGALALTALVVWQIVAARRNRARLEALVASRTRQLRQSEELFRSIFEHASEGVFHSSVDGRNLRANPAMAAILGYDGPAEMRVLLTDVSTQFYVRSERRAEFQRCIAETGVVTDFESEVRRKDGGTLWISENARTVTDPATGEAVYQGSVVDITARREMREAQEQARAAAEAASQAKSTFLAQITHELRTPLTGILGSARVALRDSSLERKNRERFSLIAESGEHLLCLIDDVLDLSRIEAGHMEPRLAPFDLADLLRTLGGDFQLRSVETGIGFTQHFDLALPRTVRGDAGRLRQVLVNLLGNAFKYTDRGEVALRADRNGTPTPMVRFEVSDTGIGIPAEQAEAIFRPFHQVAMSGRSGKGGVGLGLNISARLVELMGGTLQVASEMGRGSRFWFVVSLPAEDNGETLGEAAASGAWDAAAEAPSQLAALDFLLPALAEIETLLELSLAGDIVRLRERLAGLAATDPACAAFVRELEHLADGFQMEAISTFLQGARQKAAIYASANLYPDDTTSVQS